LRITLINQYYDPDLSPTARLATSLAEHRAAMGDEVTVVTSAARYAGNGLALQRRPSKRGANPKVWRAPAPRRAAQSIFSRALHYLSFYLGAGVRLARLPRQDVIICMTTPPYAVVLALLHRRLRGHAKLILWTMDCYPEILEAAGLIRRGGVLARFGRRINRWVFRRLAHVVCLDEAMKQLVQSSYVRNGSPAVTVIPNWEPYARYSRSVAPPPWAGEERLGLRERFVVLYLGNAGYGHEFDTVLEAAEALRDEPVCFLFVGGGSCYEALRDASDRRKLDNVYLHPYVPDEELPSVLARADLSLVTLSDAALGLMSPSKFHSYLAMSVPVIYIGPPGSNVHWAVEQFGCGVALRHGQAEQMVAFIRRARRDRPWLLEMKRKARRAFEAAYCDRRTLPQFDRLLERLSGDPQMGSDPE